MALKSVTKMLSQRWFSTSTRGITNTGGGTETSKHITDEKWRGLYERIKQATAETNQLRDECNAYFALKRAFPQDRVVWALFILSVGYNVVLQSQEILKTRNVIKDKQTQLTARRNAIKDKQTQLTARRNAIKDKESQLTARRTEMQ
ncbi:uncharacterized protein LOC113299859 [Papaver somniferum]|uniref:uncharacterized protein LOC113299859 n=1 Tax=Papaver somniferum TaxID=3469 RepID=UPI000E6F8BFE|nr:uncharacterized protein LOC113299859 [Papaver somniferum]